VHKFFKAKGIAIIRARAYRVEVVGKRTKIIISLLGGAFYAFIQTMCDKDFGPLL